MEEALALMSPHADKLASLLEFTSDAEIASSSAALLLGAFTAYWVYSLAASRIDGQNYVRRRAWLITFVSSAVMSVTGVYFAIKLLSAPRTSSWVPDWPFTPRDATLARALCLFFLAYCVVDTLCAALFYANEMIIGYGHHATYAILLAYLLVARRETLFALMSAEEIPTLMKAA